MRPAPSVSRPTSTSTTMNSPAAPPPAAAAALAASPWHSPVPYLFGGLAAMLGLIALALLILACSYWKLNNYLGTGRAATSSSSSSSGHGATGGDGGSKSPAAPAAPSPATFADLVAVVMAGEKMPTFLAAPIVRLAHGNDSAPTATREGSTPETEEEQESRGKAGEGESGVVADAERERQLDD